MTDTIVAPAEPSRRTLEKIEAGAYRVTICLAEPDATGWRRAMRAYRHADGRPVDASTHAQIEACADAGLVYANEDLRVTLTAKGQGALAARAR